MLFIIEKLRNEFTEFSNTKYCFRGLMAKESKIEEKLVKAVKKVGGKALKLVCPGYVGEPDRLILIAFGKVGFVEVKAPNKKPRKIQKKRHQELRELGFKTYVLDNENQIGGIIDDIRAT